MKIVLLEPYFTGSHASWAEGFREHSKHEVLILGLKGAFWKWRMHGGAVTLASDFLESNFEPDLLLATDMLDLTTFLALTRAKSGNLATAVYFHENQLAYPWSPTDRDVAQKRDKHYGFINYTTALTADRVFFNSRFNQDSFMHELNGLLKHFPDYRNLETIEKIRSKSEVLPLGLDLGRFDKFKSANVPASESSSKIVLWNHRWEFDKNPADFFGVLQLLAVKGVDFKVVLLGECFSEKPVEFEQACEVFGDKILHYGFVDNFAAYAEWLWRADIIPVTSRQDFFGGSVVEAIYCGCTPLLPKRLAYPELIPDHLHDNAFYEGKNELAERLDVLLTNDSREARPELREFVGKFDWQNLIQTYDNSFENLLNTHNRSGYN